MNTQNTSNASISALFNPSQEEPDKTQRVVNKFIEGLKKLGLNDQQINDLVSEYAHMIVDRIMQEITLQMDEADVERWNKFVDTGANEAQQLLILDEFYKKKSGESLEDLEGRVVEGIITSSVQQYNDSQNIKAKIEKLDKASQDKVKALLDQGDFLGAQKIVDGV